MQNNDKKYFIPVNGNPIEVSEEVYRAYYQPIWNTRFKRYNVRDVEVEMSIQEKLAKFPVPEAVWEQYHL